MALVVAFFVASGTNQRERVLLAVLALPGRISALELARTGAHALGQPL